MPEDVTKRLNVTFETCRPLGARATFTHNHQTWIAYPATKQQQIHACIDRLLGTIGLFQKRLTHWLATNPGDTQRITMLLDTLAKADQLRREITTKKCEAITA
jgi:hypothetical protein